MIEIVGIESLIRDLEEIQRRSNNLEPIHKEIGNMILNDIEMSFEESKSPFGQVWARNVVIPPNNPNKKPLINSGILSTSFTVNATANEVSVGTNLIYAAIHQFGGKAGKNRGVTIPARPYLPVSSNGELESNLQKNITDYLYEIFNPTH